MNKDTYETQATTKTLERYEWDDFWRIEAYDLTSPRLLSIGDSISRGYRHLLAKSFENRYLVDNYATSKAVDNPVFLKTIELVVEQVPSCNIIHLNNGLHGWHLSTEEYKKHYLGLVSAILEKYPDTKLILGLSTPVRKSDETEQIGERNATVIERNEAVISIAEKYKLPYTDLYSPLINSPQYYISDGVHLTEDGYTVLAKTINDKINEVF